MFKKGDTLLSQVETYPVTLSADGKTLTIQADGTNVTKWDGQYAFSLVKEKVRTAEGEYFPETTILVNSTDKVAPTVTNVEKVSSSVTRVTFSEPIINAGSYTFTYTTGGASANAVVTPDNTKIAKSYVDLTINASEEVGTSYNVSLLGALDYSNNAISPNPTTFTITKGEKDGVAPTVTAITPTALNAFTIQFSEQVNLAKTNIKIDGSLLGASDTLKQDTTDKTKYTVSLNTPLTAAIHSISIDKGVTDLSGQAISKTDDYVKAVQFSADITAPKLVSSSVKTDIDGKQYLNLVFDEKVTVATLTDTAAKAVKNAVTTVGTLTFDTSKVTDLGTEGKDWKVLLSDITFGGTALADGTQYTFSLGSNVKDASAATNALAPVNVTFTRGADSSLVGPKLTDSTPVVEGATPSKLLVNFDKELDATTATTASNYTVQGATVEKAEIFGTDLTQVVLTIKSGTITQTGNRNVTVSGVKSASGIVMNEAQTVAVNLNENVAPTFTATIVDGNTIKITFSENVKGITGASLADFDVYYDGTKVTTALASKVITSDVAGTTEVASTDEVSTVYIQLDADTIANLSKTVQVKTVGENVVDTVGNIWATATVTAN